MGISKIDAKYWINAANGTCDYSPVGSQTAFPPSVTPEYFNNKQDWIAKCNELGIEVNEKYLE